MVPKRVLKKERPTRERVTWPSQWPAAVRRWEAPCFNRGSLGCCSVCPSLPAPVCHSPVLGVPILFKGCLKGKDKERRGKMVLLICFPKRSFIGAPTHWKTALKLSMRRNPYKAVLEEYGWAPHRDSNGDSLSGAQLKSRVIMCPMSHVSSCQPILHRVASDWLHLAVLAKASQLSCPSPCGS